MKTSYYAKSGKDENAISIAIYAPRFYKGKEYTKLAPTQEMLHDYKETGDEDTYVRHYNYILSRLDAQQVYDELRELVNGEPILLCWEGRDKFCHRHLVAEWFERELNIKVEEL